MTIEELQKHKKAHSEIWFKHIKNDSKNIKKMSLNFRALEILNSALGVKECNMTSIRKSYFNAALIDKLQVEKFNSTLFDYSLSNVTYPILSDNQSLIEDYSKLRYKAWGKMPGMDENVLNGESAIWCNTVQHFMAEDVEKQHRNLNILETTTLPKLPKTQKELLIDFEFYKALLDQDKSRCEDLLEQLVSPKVHKKRNENAIFAEYVSQPALGYAKLAWRCGIEVNIGNPLIPQEILPIEPLDHYEIPYEFLKDEIS